MSDFNLNPQDGPKGIFTSKARILTDVDLFEISLVTFPANEAARVSEVKEREKGKRKERKGDGLDSSAFHDAAERLRQAARNLLIP